MRGHVTIALPKMTERHLQDAVIELAQYFGWRCYHTHDSRRSQAGFPDVTLVRDKRLIFAELKSAEGRMSAEQSEWAAALLLAGQEWYEWRPIHWCNGTIEQILRRTK